MASISRAADGTRRIQFTGPDRKRKTLRRGRISQQAADGIRCKVERLLQAKAGGTAADVETATWLPDIGAELHKRITAVGLAAPRQTADSAPAVTASRQTELEETFASHVVCSWIGNSPQVAKRHFLQVTDEHFERAVKGNAISDASSAEQVSVLPRSRSRFVQAIRQPRRVIP